MAANLRSSWFPTMADVVTFLFCISFGITTVAIPLLALDAGHGVSGVGVLAATSAGSQVLGRLGLTRMLDVFTTRILLAGAVVLMGLSSLLPVFSTELSALIIAQILQGISRAYFWTSAQTHAVVSGPDRVTSVTRMNIVVSLGLLTGPILGGFVAAQSLGVSMLISATVGVLASIPAMRLMSYPPFRKKQTEALQNGGIINRGGIKSSMAMNAVAGAWQAFLMSYIPVVLSLGGQSEGTVGLLVGMSNGATIIGALATRRIIRRPLPLISVGSIGSTVGGLVICCFVPGSMVFAALALIVSGMGAGALQTVAPVVASAATNSAEQSRAMVAIGLTRSTALFMAPIGVLGALAITPVVPLATAIGAGLWFAPTLVSVLKKERGLPGSEEVSNS